MLASRLIRRASPTTRIWNIEPRWLAKLFVGADVVCFVVQAGGSGLMSSTGSSESIADKKRLGQIIYLTGCGLQLGFIILFSFFIGCFYLRFQREQRRGKSSKAIKVLICIIFTVLTLILASSTTSLAIVYSL